MLELTDFDSGKVFYLNFEHISEVYPLTTSNGKDFTRVYLKSCHRSCVDVTENAKEIAYQINYLCFFLPFFGPINFYGEETDTE